MGVVLFPPSLLVLGDLHLRVGALGQLVQVLDVVEALGDAVRREPGLRVVVPALLYGGAHRLDALRGQDSGRYKSLLPTLNRGGLRGTDNRFIKEKRVLRSCLKISEGFGFSWWEC